LRDLQDELLPPDERGASEGAVDEYAGGAAAEPPLPPTPVMAPPGSGADLPLGGGGAPGGPGFVPEGTDDDRLMSMLAWLSMVILQLPVVSVIQLLSENTKDRPFQRHHAITSLLFYAAAIAYEILATVVFTVLTLATAGCGAICLWVLFFVPHLLALYYALQAYSGKRITLPFLSDFARKQGWM
jgi:uncharacterized membrane protein